MSAPRKLRARVCAVCGRTRISAGAIAAYDGRGYFHRACFVRARAAGKLPPRVPAMTTTDEENTR